MCGMKVKVLVTQLCLTPCDSKNWGPPGSSVLGILQARVLGWIAIAFSRGYSIPDIASRSPALQSDSLLSESIGKP